MGSTHFSAILVPKQLFDVVEATSEDTGSLLHTSFEAVPVLSALLESAAVLERLFVLHGWQANTDQQVVFQACAKTETVTVSLLNLPCALFVASRRFALSQGLKCNHYPCVCLSTVGGGAGAAR